MKTLAELQQERAQKIKAQSDLLAEVRSSEKKEFTAEEQTRFDGLTTEIESLDGKIEQARNIEAAEKRQAALSGAPVSSETSNKGEQREAAEVKKRASVTNAIRTVSAGRPLEGAEKEMSELAEQENRDAGLKVDERALLHIPMSMLRATAQTVTEDAGAFGGKLVHDQAPRVQMPFGSKTVLEQLGATRWTGLTGGAIPLPVGNNYSYSWLAETAAITPQKQEFDGPVLSPKRLGAAVEISNRLLLQSSVNVEGTIRQLLFEGYDRAINAAAINGAGTAVEPTGVLNTTGVQQSATVAGTAIARSMVVELSALIEAANASENSLAFLMSPELKAILQNAKTDAGSGIFLMDGNNQLLGYKTVSSTLVPELAGNKVLLFGDWSKLFIGEWGAMSVMSDPYSASLSNSIRLVVNGHADVAIAQPSAFAANKFITG